MRYYVANKNVIHQYALIRMGVRLKPGQRIKAVNLLEQECVTEAINLYEREKAQKTLDTVISDLTKAVGLKDIEVAGWGSAIALV